LEREHDNFRAALAWATAEGRVRDAARLALALWPFWHARTYLLEGQSWLELVLALAERTPIAPAQRARTVNALAVIAQTLGQFDRADALHGEALRLWSELGDRDGLALAVLDRGWQHFYQLNLQQALACADKSLALARQVGNRQTIAGALFLRACASSPPPPQMPHLETAIPDLEECLQIWRELGDAASAAWALSVLALGEIAAGQYERAKTFLAEALASHVQMGTIGSSGSTLAGLLQVAAHAENQPEGAIQAAQLLGAVFEWGESRGAVITSLAHATGDPIAALAKDVLGEEIFAREFAAGQRLTMEAALALALAITQPAPRQLETRPSSEQGSI
jgi:tetratricopeptide (TPR) repeat protein